MLKRFLVLLPLLATGSAGGAEPLRIGVLEDRQLAEPTQQVLSEAYSRAGYRVQFLPLPLRRAAMMLKQGQLDGDFMRTQAFFDANPELLSVKVPMRNLTFWVHGKPPCARSTGVEELARSRVAYQTGVVAVEVLLPESARLAAATPSDLLQRVRMGDASYSVMAMTPGMVTAVERRYADLCRVRLPLFTVNLYHALAAHQAPLLPALEAAFGSMQRDGSLARIWADNEPRLEDWAADPLAARPTQARR
ncbi:MAG: hypothetical protein ACK4F7_04905 [Inhella sp.]